MKACNDISTHLADSITGRYGDGAGFNHGGTVGYTLEQKARSPKSLLNLKQSIDLRVVLLNGDGIWMTAD